MNNGHHMERITTLSRRLRFAVRGIGVLLGLGMVVVLFAVGSGAVGGSMDIGGTKISLDEVRGPVRLALLGVVVPFFGLVAWLLWQTDRLLGLYARGQVFAPESGRLIRRCGQVLVALAVVDTVLGPLLLLVASQVGGVVEDISVDVNLGQFLGGFFVIVVGHVTSLGAEIAEDQALTI